MVACTVNTYTRLVPGFWAPTDATWGVENRTCALRAIPGRRSRSASSTGSRPPTSIRISRSRRRSDRASGESSTASSRTPRSRATPTRRASGETSVAAHPLGRGAAAQGSRPRAHAIRRRFRRPLCRDPGVGGARVPEGHHRLGICALFRDYLKTRGRAPRKFAAALPFFPKIRASSASWRSRKPASNRDLHLVFGSRLTAGPAACEPSLRPGD